MLEVSVVIPTYNRKDYVREAVDSVLAQTYTDYEIIVIDDGSTDGTGEALQARYGNRIRYVWQVNAGGSAARNRGWQDATASYVLFLDSDDVLLPDALADLCAIAAEQPEAGAIGGGYQCIGGDGRVLGDLLPWCDGDDLGLARWLLSCPFIPSATLVRSDWFQSVGGFDPGQEAAQDWDLWLRLALAGCPMRWLKRLVVRYRLHPDGLTANLERQKQAHLRALDKVFQIDTLPAQVRSLQGEAYAQLYMNAAARKYAAGEIDAAKGDIVAAIRFAPGQVDSGVLLERLVRKGQSPIVTDHPESYTATVLANLPGDPANSWLRRRARGWLAAADFFATPRQRDWRRMTTWWWRMVSTDTSWLRNVGVWSILLTALLGPRCADKLRRCFGKGRDGS